MLFSPFLASNFDSPSAAWQEHSEPLPEFYIFHKPASNAVVLQVGKICVCQLGSHKLMHPHTFWEPSHVHHLQSEVVSTDSLSFHSLRFPVDFPSPCVSILPTQRQAEEDHLSLVVYFGNPDQPVLLHLCCYRPVVCVYRQGLPQGYVEKQGHLSPRRAHHGAHQWTQKCHNQGSLSHLKHGLE